MIEIQSPSQGSSFGNDEDIPVSWTPPTGATYTAVTCGSDATVEPGMWMPGKDASSHLVPAASTSQHCSRIMVLVASGSGNLPVSIDMRDWAGMDGFWATCSDHVDVMVTE